MLRFFMLIFHHRWLPWAALLLVVALPLAWWLTREDKLLNVPLGVEQAAIITYGGPELAVKPFKWGVAVNVRIAQVTGAPGGRVYDVRYLVNREGDYDLRDYLTSASGVVPEGLPVFKFHGDPKMSKELEARIKETEQVGVQVGGRYYTKLTVLGCVWLACLYPLIFWGRPKRLALAPVVAPLTEAEELHGLLAKLRAGALDATGQARMEMILLRCWRAGLLRPDAPMSEVLAAVAKDGRTAEDLRRLQAWLYRRDAKVTAEEIAALVAPHAQEPVRSPVR
ncbi:MAG: hypothetical protein RL636_1370 [Verrucomicrobiota bacterium]|jgi:hypothetical protein